jgi:hypothetical protein
MTAEEYEQEVLKAYEETGLKAVKYHFKPVNIGTKENPEMGCCANGAIQAKYIGQVKFTNDYQTVNDLFLQLEKKLNIRTNMLTWFAAGFDSSAQEIMVDGEEGKFWEAGCNVRNKIKPDCRFFFEQE